MRRASLQLVLLSAATCALASGLEGCTVVVAGANGRVGSMVCRHLLRTQPGVRVRALVRSADRTEDYARLSYEVGAEEARYALRPAWSLAPEEDGGGLAWPTQAQFDPQIQGDYGLERLELVPCELRHEDDLKAALRGADAMIYCATDFSAGRRRIPQQLDNALAGISKFGADLFELRLPGFGRGLPGRGEGGRNEEEESRLARLESIRAFGSETIDDRGVALAAAVVAEEIGRKARIAALTCLSHLAPRRLRLDPLPYSLKVAPSPQSKSCLLYTSPSPRD